MPVRRAPKTQVGAKRPRVSGDESVVINERPAFPARGRDRLDWATFWVGVAGLVAVLFYTTVAYWQADLTKQALVFGNRAFVFQTGVNVSAKVSNGAASGWPISVVWQNSGNTPALDVRSRINVKYFEAPISSDFSFPELTNDPTIPATIGPKGFMASWPILVSERSVLAARDGSHYGYIWGWATYRDQLDKRSFHTTKICLQIMDIEEVKSSNGQTEVRSMMQPCPFNNCVDEDCRNK